MRFHSADEGGNSGRAEQSRWKKPEHLNDLVEQSCPSGPEQADCRIREKYISILFKLL